MNFSSDVSTSNLSITLEHENSLPQDHTQDGLEYVASAQSRVLQNSDLLDVIFSLWPSGTRNIHLLQWASLTSKQFFNPAMRVLWHSMKSWIPFIRLVEGVFDEAGILTIKGPIVEKHMRRFDFYAKFVRKFDLDTRINQATGHRVMSNLYQSIEKLRPNGPFPNLRTLIVTLSSLSPEDYTFLLLVPSDTLSHLSIKGLDMGTELIAASLLNGVSYKSQMLTRLELQAFSRCKMKNISLFKNLQDLYLDYYHVTGSVLSIPANLLSTLASCVRLGHLQLWFPPLPSEVRKALARNATFHTLHSLDIISTVDVVHDILHSMQAACLVRLVVTFSRPDEDPHPPTDATQIQEEAILLEGCVNRIVAMSQIIDTIFISSFHDVQVPGTLLPRFQSCKNLNVLSVLFDKINSEVVSSLIAEQKEWPALEELVFMPGMDRINQNPLLITELDQLVSFFPNLKILRIAVSFNVDSQKMDETSARIESGSVLSNHELEELQFTSITFSSEMDDLCRARFCPPSAANGSNATYLAQICSYIDCCFPDLKEVHFQIPYLEDQWRSALTRGWKMMQLLRRELVEEN